MRDQLPEKLEGKPIRLAIWLVGGLIIAFVGTLLF